MTVGEPGALCIHGLLSIKHDHEMRALLLWLSEPSIVNRGANAFFMLHLRGHPSHLPVSHARARLALHEPNSLALAATQIGATSAYQRNGRKS
jgi:hypothetical protein